MIHPFPVLDFEISVSAYISKDGFWNFYVSPQQAYYFSDILIGLMFLWLIILIRNFFNYSIYSDVFAKRLCERYGFTAGMRFCFKCYIIKFPVITVLSTLTLSILVLSYLIWLTEGPFYRSLNDGFHHPEQGDFSFYPFINCVYYTVITMATVGYGDYVPLTTLGKMIAIFNSILGGFIMTLTIVTLSGIFNFTI